MQNKKSMVLSIILTALVVLSWGMLFTAYCLGLNAFQGLAFIAEIGFGDIDEILVSLVTIANFIGLIVLLILLVTSVYNLLRVLNVIKYEKLDNLAKLLRKIAMIVSLVCVSINVIIMAYATGAYIIYHWGIILNLLFAIGIIVVNTMLGKSLENKAEVKEEPAKEEVAE